MRQVIQTEKAPAAIGSYSQAIKVGHTVYLSGQIPLDPSTMALEEGDARAQISRIFENIKAVAKAAGGGIEHVVKLTVYLTDLSVTPVLNDAIVQNFKKPYPARTTVQVSALPKGAKVEIEAVMVLE